MQLRFGRHLGIGFDRRSLARSGRPRTGHSGPVFRRARSQEIVAVAPEASRLSSRGPLSASGSWPRRVIPSLW